MNNNQEKEFAVKLAGIVRTAREQKNTLSMEQLKASFEGLELNDQQMDMVKDYLGKHNIGIGEPADPDEYLTPEETDYLKEYIESLKFLDKAGAAKKEGITIAAMSGDKSAQNRLIEIFLPMVPDVARIYADQGVFIEDLIGTGNEALTKAVTMLEAMAEPSEIDSFISKMLMDAMEEIISDSLDEDARGQKAVKKVQEVSDRADELAEELRRKVTVEELAGETGWSIESILEALQMSGNQIESINYNNKN